MPGMQDQLELYQRLSEGVEAWKADHVTAIFCRDIEEAISIGLAILNNIRRRGSQWANDVERGETSFSWDEARQLDDLYRWWLERSTRLLAAIDSCESKRYKVDGADDFRRANLDLSLMSLDTNRNRQSLESLQTGHGMPSKQAMDELRNSLRARGS